MRHHLILASLLFLGAAAARAAMFDVRHYGAQGDGQTLDSPAIQKAIDACAAAGGGVVRLPPGTYLSKSLFLRGDNLTLQLDAGAILQGTAGFDDYRTARGEPAGLINADGLANVTIAGAGVIDGAGAAWWPAAREAKLNHASEPRRRPKMVNFRRCRGVTVRGVTLRNSPSFHLVPSECDDILIDHVTIQAPGDSPNTDAIDPGPCRDVRILNCTLDVGDDNVAIKAGHAVAGRDFCCENILVSNCVCRHGHGVSIGSETAGGVSNVIVVHCSFDGTVSGFRIKSTREKGGRVEHILCRDLTMTNVTRPIDISCYYPKVPDTDTAQPVTATTPIYQDIRFESLAVDCPKSAGLIVGLPESPVRDVTLWGGHFHTATGLLIRNADVTIAQNVVLQAEDGAPLIYENAKVH